MQLIRARVDGYKALLDAWDVRFAQATLLTGRTSEERSAFFDALEKINPMPGRSRELPESECPPSMLKDYQEIKRAGSSKQVIEAEFLFTEQEMDMLAQSFGKGSVPNRSCIVRRYYEHDALYFDMPTNEAPAVRHFLSTSKLDKSYLQNYQDCESFVELKACLAAEPERYTEIRALLHVLQAEFPDRFIKAVEKKLPLPQFLRYTAGTCLPKGTEPPMIILTADASAELKTSFQIVYTNR